MTSHVGAPRRPMRRMMLAALICLCGAAAMPVAAQDDQAAQEGSAVAPAPGDAQLAGLVEKAVASKVRPLVRAIDELREETRFHDILGGIGYIVGAAGLAFYFLGVRRQELKRGPAAAGDGGNRGTHQPLES